MSRFIRAACALVVIAFMAPLTGCLPDVPLPAPAISIEPAQPGTQDDLVLVVEDAPEGLVLSVTWSRDTEPQDPLADELTVPSSATTLGEVWSATASFSDGSTTSDVAVASVEIVDGGDDDDSGDDDDDSTGDDDDSGDDDDDATLPPGTEPPMPSGLCAAPTAAMSSAYRVSACTGPNATIPGRASNSSFIVVVGSTRPVQIEDP